MLTLPTRHRITASMGALELFLLGFMVGLFFVGTIGPSLFSNINSWLALKIVGGLWGGLAAAIILAAVILSCIRYASVADTVPTAADRVPASLLWGNYAACAASTLYIKILSFFSGFALVLGCGAVFSLNIREKMHLSMAASIAIMVVGGIVGFLSFAVLPQLALNLAAREHLVGSTENFVYEGLRISMFLSGPISAVAAVTIEVCSRDHDGPCSPQYLLS